VHRPGAGPADGKGPEMGLGLVRVEGIQVGPAPAALSADLDHWIQQRGAADLNPAEEALRKASRDILRNGKYKPTGRGKPASEYLLRAAREDSFPRINGPVDANNLISLRYCVAISLWDLDLAGVDQFEFRLGAEDEQYAFNPSGQVLGLRDLVCGCGLGVDRSTPLVTPIKDGMATKIGPATTRLAGAIYYPLNQGGADSLSTITGEFLSWLRQCGQAAEGASAMALPGETITL